MNARRDRSSNGLPTIQQKIYSERARFVVLAVFLSLVFLTGGGSRGDIQSLVFLRPVAALLLGYGLMTVTVEQCRRFAFPLAILCGLLFLALIQLIPLPPSLWQALPGREVVTALDTSLGLGGVSRPLTLSPSGTVNAAFSLLVPLATLILAIQLTGKQHADLLMVLIVLGFLTAALGIVQLIGDSHSPLYTFRITNRGSPVGLFANRNHQAVFLSLLIPLMILWAFTASGNWNRFVTPRGRRTIIAAAATLIIAALILIIGSRTGIAALVVALFGSTAMVLLQTNKTGTPFGWRIRLSVALLFLIVVASVVYLVVGQGRGLAFDRLASTDASEEARTRVHPRHARDRSRDIPFRHRTGLLRAGLPNL